MGANGESIKKNKPGEEELVDHKKLKKEEKRGGDKRFVKGRGC